MHEELRLRNHSPYWAFVVHRLSGVVLAVFLPVHMFVLSLALEESALLDKMLNWTRQPLVSLAETLLVGLLAVHLTGGLRLLALEFLPWSEDQKTRIAIASGIAFAAALLFLLRAV